MQNYNSVLTLSHLYGLSDAILVHENDTVHRICAQLLNIKHISFGDVNRVIAHQLASVLQPALTTDSYGDYSRNPLGERRVHLRRGPSPLCGTARHGKRTKGTMRRSPDTLAL